MFGSVTIDGCASLENDRMLVLLQDGRWDGWPVRWVAIDDGWRAVATGASGVERVVVHWDAGQDGSGPWFRRAGRAPIALEPLADADEPIATRRSETIGDVDAFAAGVEHTAVAKTCRDEPDDAPP